MFEPRGVGGAEPGAEPGVEEDVVKVVLAMGSAWE